MARGLQHVWPAQEFQVYQAKVIRMWQRLWTLGMCVVLGAGCVSSSQGDQMREEIDALRAEQTVIKESFQKRETEMAEAVLRARAEIQELQKLIREAEELLRSNVATAGVDLQNTRQEVEQLRGRGEEMEFKVAKLEQDLLLFKQDVELRLTPGSQASQAQPLPDNASDLLKMGAASVEKEPRQARRALEAFLARFPEDSRVDEAIYLLGESYFNEKQTIGAILEYQKILKAHPRSKRTADATFRIGQGFRALGKCEQAKLFFETVIADHSKSDRAREARQELKSFKGNQC
jgi:TolA-binding protein